MAGVSLLSDDDLYLFNEGSHYRLYEKLGSHLMKVGEVSGCYFAVWAPNAQSVTVSGDWNGWNRESDKLYPKGQSGIWEGFIPGVGQGAIYKYHIVAQGGTYRVDKADPYAVHQETPPKTGSVVWDLAYEWEDAGWMASRIPRIQISVETQGDADDFDCETTATTAIFASLLIEPRPACPTSTARWSSSSTT